MSEIIENENSKKIKESPSRSEKINILLEEWEDIAIQFPKTTSDIRTMTEWTITKTSSSKQKEKHIRINEEDFVTVPLYQICLKRNRR